MRPTLDDVTWLIERMERSGLAELHYAAGSTTIILRRRTATPLAANSTPRADGPRLIVSPGIGLFRRTHPGVESEAITNDMALKGGAIIGYLDRSPGYELIRADHDGIVDEVLIYEGAVVGYGTPLIRYRPS